MSESKLKKQGFELSEVNIIQAAVSDIRHRSDCDTYIEMCGRKVLPVIVAPMGAVTDETNYKIWLENNFICVVPRTVDFDKRLEISKETFVSFSLGESESLCDAFNDNEKHYICIDIAHGTMQSLYDVCKKLKNKFGDKIIIMTGNIANPDAYDFYCSYLIDYVRVTIGAGSSCITSCNVGIHYPTASLVDELRMKRDKWLETHDRATEIIVDGGISNFDDIQKCLALGAFAVMNGSFFAKSEEACGEVRFLENEKCDFESGKKKPIVKAKNYKGQIDKVERIDDLYRYSGGTLESGDFFWVPGNIDVYYIWDGSDFQETYSIHNNTTTELKPYRKYFGMSTKHAQKQTGGLGNKTSEGITRLVCVEYPIAKWADNMKSYLASAMSYCGCRTVEQFRNETELIVNLSGDKSFRK